MNKIKLKNLYKRNLELKVQKCIRRNDLMSRSKIHEKKKKFKHLGNYSEKKMNEAPRESIAVAYGRAE